MKNVSHKNGWFSREIQIHVEPHPTNLTKIKTDTKLEKYDVKIKLPINTTLEAYDIYDFKMSLFENGYPEEFFWLQNYQMMIKSSVNIMAGAKL